jgi:hypothetical protein
LALNSERVREKKARCRKLLAAPEEIAKGGGRYGVAFALCLRKDFAWGPVCPEDDWKADHAFAANQCDLCFAAIALRDDRTQSTLHAVRAFPANSLCGGEET